MRPRLLKTLQATSAVLGGLPGVLAGSPACIPPCDGAVCVGSIKSPIFQTSTAFGRSSKYPSAHAEDVTPNTKHQRPRLGIANVLDKLSVPLP